MRNKFNPTTGFAAILGFVLMLLLNNSAAQESDQEDFLDDDSVEVIVVTAKRIGESTLDLAASIGQKKGDEVKLDSAALQSELLNSIAGVRVTQTGSTVGHKTSIRMPSNTGPYYLFLRDGIPVQSSGFFNHNGLSYTNFTSAGSAEVLKGAGTALYGSDAVAATINILTKTPGEDKELRTTLLGGSDGFLKLGIGGDWVFDDYSSIGGDYAYAKSDGWRDHTAYTRDELTATHLYSFNAENNLKTMLTANKTDAEMAGSLIGLDELENNPESVGDIADALESGLEINRKFDFARLSAEWANTSFENTYLNTIFYIRNTRNRYVATWEDNLPQNDSEQFTLGLMFKVDRDMGSLRTVAGLDLEYTQAEQKYIQLFDFVPSGWGASVDAGEIYNYDVDYTALAPYLRLEIEVSDSLQLAGGLRYDTNKFDYTNNLEDGQYGDSSYVRVASGENHTFNHLSPKLDLTYRFNKNHSSYLRYANGFRIPQASRLYMRKTNNIDSSLDPEVTDTLEWGYKAVLESHHFEAALYYMLIDDTIVRRENDQGDRYYVNGGETEHKGVELSLATTWGPQFSTKLAYSYSKHNFKDDETYGNNEMSNAPNSTANVRLFYEPGYVPGLIALLEWVFVDSYWLDDRNKRAYGGYDLWNLKFLYKVNNKLDLYARANNITDEIYAEDASYSWGKEKYTPGAPRQIFVGLDYRW